MLVVNPIDVKSLTKEEQKRVKKSKDILERVRRRAVADSPEFFEAFYAFEFVPVMEKNLLDTDGESLFYNPDCLLACYEQMRLLKYQQALWHITLHCLLGHLRDSVGKRGKKRKHKEYDEQVEKCMMQLKVLKWDWDNGGDNHAVWYQMFETAPHPEGEEAVDKNTTADKAIVTGEKSDAFQRICTKWNQIEESIEQGLGEFNRKILEKHGWGKGTGEWEMEFEIEQGSGLNYKEALRKVFRPKMRQNETDDCFDMMLYQYGYELNPVSPLIEPSEETYVNTLSNVAIAIDVSGSCAEYQEEFLRELNGILEKVDNIERLTCFHCDTNITFEKSYINQRQLGTEVLEELRKVLGFGGTDFRPVFQRLEEIQKEENIKYDILIYYSDLYGDFPDKKPEYPVYFVVPDVEELEEEINEWLPEWVNVLMMKE